MAAETKKTPLPVVGNAPKTREEWLAEVPDTPSKGEPFELPEGDARFVFEASRTSGDGRDLPDAADGTRPMPDAQAKRFPHSPREGFAELFDDYSEEKFGDWKWQQRRRFKRLEQLEKYITV